jgi:hypothetical protein
MSSWYHFTHYGVFSWLKHAGFSPDAFKIDAAAPHYHGLFNTASLIGLPKKLSRWLVQPLYLLHRLLWKVAGMKRHDDHGLEQRRHLATTGAVHFIARK